MKSQKSDYQGYHNGKGVKIILIHLINNFRKISKKTTPKITPAANPMIRGSLFLTLKLKFLLKSGKKS